MFWTKFRKSTPASSSIRTKYEEYQERGGRSHMGGNDRPQINDEKEAEGSQLINERPSILLRKIIWTFCRRVLKL